MARSDYKPWQQVPTTFFESVHPMRGECYFEPASDGQPTTERPGSRAKIELLAARLQRGEELWHEDDRTARPKHYGLIAQEACDDDAREAGQMGLGGCR